jgi:hypothetical protein
VQLQKDKKIKMVDKHLYQEIANKHGYYASWAVWADEGSKPKSNVGDLTIFDLNINPGLLEMLNPNIVMVGFNISRKIEFTYGNFHDGRPQSQDYKIRYAFKESPFYGAYMTDIIKDFEHLISRTVASYLKSNRDFEEQNITSFKKELIDIKSNNPIILAFGNHAHDLLVEHFNRDYQIIRVPHYSMYISKEDYKRKVEKIALKIER